MIVLFVLFMCRACVSCVHSGICSVFVSKLQALCWCTIALSEQDYYFLGLGTGGTNPVSLLLGCMLRLLTAVLATLPVLSAVLTALVRGSSILTCCLSKSTCPCCRLLLFTALMSSWLLK